ncbi:MAG TPA: serine/threonine-protein kinase, partial [Kofleriaceae bacterium]|nr:serine/threonine-protein kinase [Kofleriaceae bacterium]
LDFGIAKLAGDDNSRVKTRTGMVMGTPVYMSPEQCRGASGIDARSDIYALGCVLFAMVCGKPPFESEATGDIIIMHVRDAPPIASSIVPGLPPVLDAVIGRCLEKDPARRFQNTAELVQGLASVEAVLFANPAIGPGGTPGSIRPHLTPAAALAYRQNPTPAPPDAYTQIAEHNKPTTLSSANGATPTGPGATMPPKNRRGLVIGGLAIAVLAIGAGVFALGTSSGGKSPGPQTPGPGSAVSPVVVAPVDAQTVAAPQPPPVDAAALGGEVDAGVVATEPVDAGVAATVQTKVIDKNHGKHSLPKGGGHVQKGSNAGTTSTGSVDRGD